MNIFKKCTWNIAVTLKEKKIHIQIYAQIYVVAHVRKIDRTESRNV